MKTIRAVMSSIASFFLGILVMPFVPFFLAYWNWQDRDYDKEGLMKECDDDKDAEEDLP